MNTNQVTEKEKQLSEELNRKVDTVIEKQKALAVAILMIKRNSSKELSTKDVCEMIRQEMKKSDEEQEAVYDIVNRRQTWHPEEWGL